MKKRLLSIILAVALVASMMVFPVGGEAVKQDATAQNVTPVTDPCPCGCGKSVSQVEWKPYNVNVDGNLAHGHYYLAEDYVQTKEQRTIMAGDHVVLDLRGHTLSTDYAGRLYLIYGNLYVLDTVGGGRMMSTPSGGGFGGVVMLSIYETGSSLFELHSGTLTMDPKAAGGLRGGLVSVGQNSTFRMLGGMITDGRTVASDLGSQGGALAGPYASSNIEILGGTIMNCSSVTNGGSIYNIGTTLLKNCKILGGTAENAGGNIYQGGGSLTMENCEIAYGAANGDLGGGNIYITAANLTDTGSTIRDGFANGGTGNGGGNLLIGSGTHTLKSTKIYGGVSWKYGANILNWVKTTTRMEDCEISGDVRWAGAGLVLAGKTKIGLCNNGLNLVGSSVTSSISGSELTEGAEIFVSASHGTKFTTDSVNLEYFKPALRTVITQNDDGTLTGNMAASGTVGGYCPHCYDPENPQKVTWTAFGTGVLRTECYADTTGDNNPACTGEQYHVKAGHYYLSQNLTTVANGAKRFKIHAGDDVVLDLNGLKMVGPYRAFVGYSGSSLSILDFNGSGSLTSIGGVDYSGGIFYGQEACTVNIYGGRLVYNMNASKHVAKGGVIYAVAGSSVNIHGGTIDGSQYNKTVGTTRLGGAICLDGASNFTMTAGRILGGKTYRGSALSFGASTVAEITGGVVVGDTAANGGGAISAYGTSSNASDFTMKNCAVYGGNIIGDNTNIASASRSYAGGAMQMTYMDAEIDNCYIIGGNTECLGSYGGNVSFGVGSATISNSIIANGRAPKGGNVYVASVSTALTMTDCIITMGEAYRHATGAATTDGNGGNVFANNGLVTLQGGEISFGVGANVGGNIYAHTGLANSTTYPDASDDKTVLEASDVGPVNVWSGKSTSYGGNIYTDGKMELLDACPVNGRGSSGQDIYLARNSDKTAFTVGTGVTGDVRMVVANALLGTPVYGNPIAQTSATKVNANITLENIAGEPRVLAKDGKLYVAEATVVDADGAEQWYCTNADAVNACDAEQYIKLYSGRALVLNKDCFVDLNGQTVSVSGTGTLYGMDNSGDTYEIPTGKATWANVDAVKTGEITYAPGGNKYVAVTDGASVTYHRLGMDITDVALRPSNAGIYYKGSWKCDSVLADMVQEYGIAVSTANMPAANFRNEAAEGEEAATDNLWVTYDGAKMNGSVKCGVIISNIFKDGKTAEENKTRGEMPVYATAYMTLKNGTTFVSDNAADDTDDIGYSLRSFMELVDELVYTDPTHFRRLEKPMKEFYAVWENKGCGEWVFNRLEAPVDPATDDELNILFVASSACYYYVEELQAMLTGAGYNNVRVCNLYYSGCRLQWHYEWWRDGKENYQLFITDDTGRHGINGVSMEYALAQYNWDAIITIEGTSYMRTASANAQEHFNKTKVYLDELVPYWRSEFPGAQLYYQEAWSYQIGWNNNGFKVESTADQQRDMELFRAYSNLVCAEYDMIPANLGEAWQAYRAVANASDEDGLIDNLCARLASNNGAGDNSHDGDTGGGQLLNACVWYEILTGLDCRENDYVPTYTHNNQTYELSEELVVAIKEAAHKAVTERFASQG